ncbi:hypothetical protein Tco_1503069, partial [Tanacetum coccineum]
MSTLHIPSPFVIVIVAVYSYTFDSRLHMYVVPTGRVIATVSIKVPTGRIVPAGYIVP